MKNRKKFSIVLKWAIVLVVLSSFILLFVQQQPKQNNDVLAKQAKEISTMPVQISTITGRYDDIKQESSRQQSAKKQKEDASNKSQDEATNEETLTEQAKKENHNVKNENTGLEKSEDAKAIKEATKGETASSQQRSPDGTGQSAKTNGKNPNDIKGETTSKEANAKEIVSGLKDENPYFTTSIQNNETVSKATYKFSITYKNKKMKVLKTTVSVNDLVNDEFSGEVALQEGENTITVQVLFDGRDEVVERKYTVYFAENKLIIRTNLRDGMKTTNKTIQFTASSYFNETEYAVAVKLAGEKLTENEEGLYEASLLAGQNEFTFFAEKDGEIAEKTVHIQYDKKVNRIVFETDLQNKQVSSAEFSFYAIATLNGEEMPLTVKLNEEKITGKNDFYFDLLKDGKNTVEISAKIDGEVEQENYVIYYNEPDEISNNTVPDDEEGPIIKTDLKNGTQIRGSIKNINVWATDHANKKLQGSHVAVVVNGKGIGFIWDDQEKTSYKLVMREGENKVVIKAWDAEGRITTKSFKVYAKNIDEGNVIGQATISLEATTLGLGKLIPPTKVDIHEGEKASYVIDQFLREHQYTYTNTGTLDANFYLAAISKANITKGLKIPTDLAKIVEKNAEYYEPTDYSANSLGEFTISNGSGWMYSINGDYPNYGFSDAYLLDGDVVRIRFTLFYGADIAGFGASGNSSNEEDGGNANDWHQEW